MKTYKYIFIFALIALVSACGSGPDNQEETTGEKTATQQTATAGEQEETTALLFHPEATKIIWTAYKTSAKVGVKGGFDDFTLDGVKAEAATVSEMFGKAVFHINSASVNTGNPERDAKLVKFFFSNMNMPSEINGEVKSMDDQGNALLLITMNDVTKEVPAKYVFENNTLVLSADIVMDDWGLSGAAKDLNTECKDLHTGDDGKSVLWPDVHIEISTDLSAE